MVSVLIPISVQASSVEPDQSRSLLTAAIHDLCNPYELQICSEA